MQINLIAQSSSVTSGDKRSLHEHGLWGWTWLTPSPILGADPGTEGNILRPWAKQALLQVFFPLGGPVCSAKESQHTLYGGHTWAHILPALRAMPMSAGQSSCFPWCQPKDGREIRESGEWAYIYLWKKQSQPPTHPNTPRSCRSQLGAQGTVAFSKSFCSWLIVIRDGFHHRLLDVGRGNHSFSEMLNAFLTCLSPPCLFWKLEAVQLPDWEFALFHVSSTRPWLTILLCTRDVAPARLACVCEQIEPKQN